MTESQSSKRSILLLLAVALAAPSWAQRGALTVPRNLSQLTDRASIIVRGNVISARVEKHPDFKGLHTVVVTLRVKETLKGEAGDTFTFRQYIWDIRDRYDAAGYRKGQEVLLMMIGPNQYGLSGLAGMQQGRFRIFRDKTGKEVAVNGQSNFKLLEGVEAQAAKKGVALSTKSANLARTHRGGPVAAADLEVLIRELVAGGSQ